MKPLCRVCGVEPAIKETNPPECYKCCDRWAAGLVVTQLETPCPRCGLERLICISLLNEKGQHNHTYYKCVSYASGRRSPCDWGGWTVPGWDER